MKRFNQNYQKWNVSNWVGSKKYHSNVSGSKIKIEFKRHNSTLFPLFSIFFLVSHLKDVETSGILESTLS